jgi:hypothetical protein
MKIENSQKAHLKKKVIHEGREFAVIFSYLAFLFCSLATYSMLLLKEFHVSYFNYGFALANAFAVAHVIPMGEHMHLGKRQETKPLLLSAVNKAFLFTLLVLVFHFAEEWIKRLLGIRTHEMRIDDLLGRSLVLFCSFIPLFAFMELRRVMGEEKFRDLLFRKGATAKSDLFSGI